MKLSKKGEYALRTLIYLGLAAEEGRTLVRVSELAGNERIPGKFLEQIMQSLKEAGAVASVRGKFGGYRLAKPAREIRIGAIVRWIDGPLAPIACVSQTAYAPCSCPDEDHCGLRMLMLDVRNAIAGILDRYTLGDVVDVTLRKLRRDGVTATVARKSHPRPAGRAATRGSGRAAARRSRRRRLDVTDGVIHQLFEEYSI
ncbi:MAG: Rrf2 family transcriptional regulator [Verrucomicrobia bacterium]|nr:Rrf2 family transcriptional regulator [Verrucomicrobiota bacterium]